MNAEQYAKNLIDTLLQRAETDAEFLAWKAAHPEKDEKFAAMTHDEKVNEIIRLLDELGLIAPASDADGTKGGENE